MFPIWSEPEWLDVAGILFIPISAVITGYILLRAKHSAAKRRAGGTIIAVISGTVGAIGIMAYAIPALSNFPRPASVPLGDLMIWSICLGALAIALRALSAGFCSRN